MTKDPWFRNRLIRDAMYAATEQAMDRDPRVILLGEGSEIKVQFDAPHILKKYHDRILTMPIAEDASVDFAVGLAIGGMVPVVDIISSDFMLRAADSICNTAAKLSAVGQPRTIVIKAEFMTGGPTSGQRIESMFVGQPGLHVCCPSTPMDAYSCMRTALGHPGVTVMFEDRMIEDGTTPEHQKQHYSSAGPRRLCAIRRKGDALTVVSYAITSRLLGSMLRDVDADQIDLCWLYPIDWDAILDSVARTRSLLVVEPDSVYSGIGAEIVAHVAEKLPGVKVARMGAPRTGIPACRDQHWRMLPTKEAVLAKCREMANAV